MLCRETVDCIKPSFLCFDPKIDLNSKYCFRAPETIAKVNFCLCFFVWHTVMVNKISLFSIVVSWSSTIKQVQVHTSSISYDFDRSFAFIHLFARPRRPSNEDKTEKKTKDADNKCLLFKYKIFFLFQNFSFWMIESGCQWWRFELFLKVKKSTQK